VPSLKEEEEAVIDHLFIIGDVQNWWKMT